MKTCFTESDISFKKVSCFTFDVNYSRACKRKLQVLVLIRTMLVNNVSFTRDEAQSVLQCVFRLY